MKKLLIIILFICVIANANAESWSGTGFALNGKYVITNHHVVDGARTLLVRGVRGDFTKTYNAVVVATDAMHDMAIIRIEDSQFPGFGEIPYTLKQGLSEVGEDIFVLGYPLLSSMGDEIKLTTGVISSRSGIQGDVSAYQISAPIQPGNSGGPLFDANGDVVGIVNAKHRQADNAGYAIKSPYMRLFIQNSVGDKAIPTNRKMVGWSLVSKTKAVKPFIFIIYATNEGRAPIQSQQSTSQTYEVGDVLTINGVKGVIFEVSDGGRHGKIMSSQEIFCNWNRAKSWSVGLGTNWRLPSVDEMLTICRNLNKIFLNKPCKINGAYWTREEYGTGRAWRISSGNRDSSHAPKEYEYNVRAVSAF